MEGKAGVAAARVARPREAAEKVLVAQVEKAEGARAVAPLVVTGPAQQGNHLAEAEEMRPLQSK